MASPDKTPDLTLYHHPHSRSPIVRWMLEEVGQPYAIKLMDLAAGDQRKPDFLKLNTMGKIPLLVADGVPIAEGPAICLWLADRFPAKGLAPAPDAPDRGPCLRWLFFSGSVLEPALMDAHHQRESPPAQAGWGDLERVLNTLEEGLAKHGEWLLPRFSAADVMIGSGLRFAMMFGMLEKRKSFTDYVARLEARPALQRTLAKDAALLEAKPA
ncbi:MAG: glutathione S-transferase family protein [Alphaproteobacteria bacterium]